MLRKEIKTEKGNIITSVARIKVEMSQHRGSRRAESRRCCSDTIVEMQVRKRHRLSCEMKTREKKSYHRNETVLREATRNIYHTPGRSIIDYCAISSALLQGSHPSIVKPFRMFAMTMTAFHLATRPSSKLTVAEASIKYGLPDLALAIIPPSSLNPFGKYDLVILSSELDSDWLKHGLAGHCITQL